MLEEREHLFLLLHPMHFLWRECCVLFSIGEVKEDRTRKQNLAYVYVFTMPHAETLEGCFNMGVKPHTRSMHALG